MNKNLALLLTLLSFPISSSAQENKMATSSGSKNGFYIGVGIGGAFTQYKFDTFGTANGVLRSVHSDKSSALANVFAGYGATFDNNFYIGGELSTNFPTRKITFSRLNASVSSTSIGHLSIQDYIAMDLLPGVYVNANVLIYGRLGTSLSHLSFTQDANPSVPTPFFRFKMNQLSSRVGAGVNYRLNEHFSVAADYIYTSYKVMTGFYEGFPAEFKNEDSSNYAGLSLIYSFA